MYRGQTGVGKTFLAHAIGLHACACGKSVVYMTVTTWLERIALARSSGTYLRYRDKIERPDVLIVDDMGSKPSGNHVVAVEQAMWHGGGCAGVRVRRQDLGCGTGWGVKQRLYVPWQKRFELSSGGGERKTLVQMREVRQRVDPVRAAGACHGVEVCAGASAKLSVYKQPCASSDGKRPDVVFHPIVVSRDFWMLEKAGQLVPLRYGVG